MGITADKTKPQSLVTYTVTEVHIVPGSQEITIAAVTNDAEVKKVHKTINIQNKINAVNVTLLNQINGFFNRAVADVLDVGEGDVVGELFSKST